MKSGFCQRVTLAFLCCLLTAHVQSASAQDELKIGTWNIKFFYDADTSDNESNLALEQSAPSSSEFSWRVRATGDAIAEINVNVLALQEIENEEVVEDLAEYLEDEHDLDYDVVFVQGWDGYTEQDVAFLVDGSVEDVEYGRFPFSGFNQAYYKNISKHVSMDFTFNGERFHLINVHLITSLYKRKKQARTLRAWIDSLPADNNVVVLGDFNFGLRYNETTPQSEVGRIRGLQTDSEADDLVDLHKFLPWAKRRTHKNGRELDRIMISQSLFDSTGMRFRWVDNLRGDVIRGDNVDGFRWNLPRSERDLSDHYPLVLTLENSSSEEGSPVSPLAGPVEEGGQLERGFDLTPNSLGVADRGELLRPRAGNSGSFTEAEIRRQIERIERELEILKRMLDDS
ncbi:MAG: endonuclease/exonuclease/phosphatase family protein [Planctomycetota bacterium]